MAAYQPDTGWWAEQTRKHRQRQGDGNKSHFVAVLGPVADGWHIYLQMRSHNADWAGFMQLRRRMSWRLFIG
jgi:hypothetical protein